MVIDNGESLLQELSRCDEWLCGLKEEIESRSVPLEARFFDKLHGINRGQDQECSARNKLNLERSDAPRIQSNQRSCQSCQPYWAIVILTVITPKTQHPPQSPSKLLTPKMRRSQSKNQASNRGNPTTASSQQPLHTGCPLSPSPNKGSSTAPYHRSTANSSLTKSNGWSTTSPNPPTQTS